MDDRQRVMSYPQDEGLYHFSNEHDACGVGMVVDLNGEPCHENVLRGLTVLKRLQHRGAAGSDALSGDGAGLLCPIPHEFFQCQLEGILPEPGSYALAMMFNGVGEEAVLESVIEEEGCRILAWRDVPTDPSQLGEQARQSRPTIRQFFVESRQGLSGDALERKVFISRRRLERELLDVYFPSFSTVPSFTTR